MQSDGIFYSSSHGSNLVGYTDNDWAGDTIQRRSTSGYVFSLGTSVFSWSRYVRWGGISNVEDLLLGPADLSCELAYLGIVVPGY